MFKPFKRTWPYGTEVKVIKVTGNILVAVGDEAFVLSGIDVSGVSVGQEIVIVFKCGGPTGGYWDVKR